MYDRISWNCIKTNLYHLCKKAIHPSTYMQKCSTSSKTFPGTFFQIFHSPEENVLGFLINVTFKKLTAIADLKKAS